MFELFIIFRDFFKRFTIKKLIKTVTKDLWLFIRNVQSFTKQFFFSKKKIRFEEMKILSLSSEAY